MNVPLVLVAFVGCVAWLSWRHPIRGQAKLDLAGSALIMVTLLSLTLVLVKGNAWGWTSQLIIGTQWTSISDLYLDGGTRRSADGPASVI